MHVPELASLERAEAAEHTLLHADTAVKDSRATAEKMTAAKWMCGGGHGRGGDFMKALRSNIRKGCPIQSQRSRG